EIPNSQRSVPVEVIEIETVLVMRAIRLVPGSRRAGKYVSGAALEIEMENTAYNATITVRNLNRFIFAPWGAQGGEKGLLGKVTLNPGSPDEKDIGKISVLELRKNDILRITSSTGGAFGNPYERELDDIDREIKSGMLTVERAIEAYGVIATPTGEIDMEASAKHRSSLLRSVRDDFTFCSERIRQDSVWSSAVRRELAITVLELEQRIRSQVAGSVHQQMLDAGKSVTTEMMCKAVIEESFKLTGIKPQLH
ncbi:hydantoinase B/oxoprolinase family protein, partial [Pantoea endophytica]